MEGEFTIKIKLGNDAMHTRADVATAIEKVRQQVLGYAFDGPIRDENGNRVGVWELTIDD